jgi:hypothetical protein
MDHEWMKGDMPSADQIRQEFTKREAMVKAAIEEEREANKHQKESRTGQHIAARRSGGEEEEKNEEVFLKP